MMQNVNQTQPEYANHMHAECDQEEEEKPVVPSTYTVVDPGTVMVKCLEKKIHSIQSKTIIKFSMTYCTKKLFIFKILFITLPKCLRKCRHTNEDEFYFR